MRSVAALGGLVATVGLIYAFVTTIGIGFLPGVVGGVPNSVRLPLGVVSGLAIDGRGRIYLASDSQERILRFDSRGEYQGAIDVPPAKSAVRIAVDQQDHVWIASACTVRRHAPDGTHEQTFALGLGDCSDTVVVLGEDGEPRIADERRAERPVRTTVAPGEPLFDFAALRKEAQLEFRPGGSDVVYRVVTERGVPRVERGRGEVLVEDPLWLTLLAFPWPGPVLAIALTFVGALIARLGARFSGEPRG